MSMGQKLINRPNVALKGEELSHAQKGSAEGYWSVFGDKKEKTGVRSWEKVWFCGNGA